MAKSVITIPATRNKYTAAPIGARKKRKVAAYARVSTDHEEQQSSYEAQVDYYTNYITSRDDWEFVSVYADEGITGCNTKKRDGFNRMVEDALNGRIDLIITKSVSRFARNTVDSLTTIRKLKEHGTEWRRKRAAPFPKTAPGDKESGLPTVRSPFRSSGSSAMTEARTETLLSTRSRQKSFAEFTECSCRGILRMPLPRNS